MIPHRLNDLMLSKGKLEAHPVDQVFHAQNFEETLFMLKTGYVKRYQVGTDGQRVIELIYGPGHIFPLSQLYKRLFGSEQNQENLVYVYQAMTDIEIYGMSDNDVVALIEKDNALYVDLYYEAGLRLKSNIQRLASNALKDDYKKVAHQLVCLVDEFGEAIERKGGSTTRINVPLKPVDMAEQLNMSADVSEAVMNNLVSRGLIAVEDNFVYVADVDALKDVYL